uniref:DUF5682 family protein n=1 Tax=Burkholderia sp. Ac-20379 TaxID=2703900 RepID=UPI001D6C3616
MTAAAHARPAAPCVIGVRHHSPACARLVAARIRERRPRYVLIEGPADFNARLDELALPHRLPVAIYSYLSSEHAHHGSWTPFAEHSPEWQALAAARETGAALRFIDLPAWHAAFHGLENRYADIADAEHEARAEAYERALSATLGVEGRDALWDHLFEDADASPEALDRLEQHLSTYFVHLRGDAAGSAGNRARERAMACWIAWAVGQTGGHPEDVLVVCGGYHAPALAALWREMPADLPELPRPGAADSWAESLAEPSSDSSAESPVEPQAGTANGAAAPAEDADIPRHGSYLVPYTFKRLDAFSGYASGMPSPAYYQWRWEQGADGAARQALERVMRRLRERGLPASTADLLAGQGRADGLARMRGHARPLRCDWLDALAGALVKDALDAPLPWTYRGALRAGTDPVLVETMDVLAGDAAGALAPGTPQPPLVHAVREELAAFGIVLRGAL